MNLKNLNLIKLCLLFINPLTISILLFVPLMSHNSYGSEESVIPESHVSGGDGSGGENLGQEESVIPESDITQGIIISKDGTITASPEIIARFQANAASLIENLKMGVVNVFNEQGQVIQVHVDTQQNLANILEQNQTFSSDGNFNFNHVSMNEGSNVINASPGDFVNTLSNAVNENPVFVTSDKFDVTITPVGVDNSLNLKSYKTSAATNTKQTLRIEVINNTTGKTTTQTVTGAPEKAKSAATTITALTLAAASPEAINLAKAIALDTGVEPNLLVNLMLNYEGLYPDNSTNAQLASPVTVANKSDSGKSSDTSNQKSKLSIAKFANSIQAHNQIIKQSQPETFKALNGNTEFQLIAETLERMRKSL